MKKIKSQLRFFLKKPSLVQNVDLYFKSPIRQGRHVNSHPLDGVDLCQLRHLSTIYIVIIFKIYLSMGICKD